MTAISAATSHICITSLLCWVELRIKIPFSRKRTQSQYYVQKILDLDESIHFGQPWHHRKCYCTCAWVFPDELTFRRTDWTISPPGELTGIPKIQFTKKLSDQVFCHRHNYSQLSANVPVIIRQYQWVFVCLQLCYLILTLTYSWFQRKNDSSGHPMGLHV